MSLHTFGMGKSKAGIAGKIIWEWDHRCLGDQIKEHFRGKVKVLAVISLHLISVCVRAWICCWGERGCISQVQVSNKNKNIVKCSVRRMESRKTGIQCTLSMLKMKPVLHLAKRQHLIFSPLSHSTPLPSLSIVDTATLLPFAQTYNLDAVVSWGLSVGYSICVLAL